MFTSVISLYLVTFCRGVVAFAFMLSSISKAIHFAAFEQAITSFRVLPVWLSRSAALVVCGGEVIVVALLLVGHKLLAPGFLLALGLLVAFCFALISALVRRIQTSCNCFGPTEKLISSYDVARNIGFITCALMGWIILSTTKAQQFGLTLGASVLVGIAAVTFVIVWINLADIAQVFRAVEPVNTIKRVE